jgi:hypothetical protein
MKDWVIALIVVCITVLLLAFKYPPEGGEAWAAWVQAVGSVAAISWAVWLANAENRRRKYEAMEVAELTAATMDTTIFRMLTRLGAMRDRIAKYGLEQPNIYIETIEDLKSIPQWTATELAPLAPLPNKCAVDLALASEMIRVAIDLIDIELKTGAINSEEGRQSINVHAKGIIQEIIIPLQRAKNEVSAAVERAKAHK